jgi:SanA protein
MRFKYYLSINFKFRWFLYFLIFLLWSIWFINININLYKRHIVDDCINDIKNYQIAIVLGAGVDYNNKPSLYYIDRLNSASILYEQAKIDKILVSAKGNGFSGEIQPALNYLLSQGINEDIIYLDYKTYNTYSSFYRAKNKHNINEALIITQRFHLPRALYLARKMGIDALGCVADNHQYENIEYNYRREILAKVKAWLDINLKTNVNLRGPDINWHLGGKKTWLEN